MFALPSAGTYGFLYLGGPLCVLVHKCVHVGVQVQPRVLMYASTRVYVQLCIRAHAPVCLRRDAYVPTCVVKSPAPYYARMQTCAHICMHAQLTRCGQARHSPDTCLHPSRTRKIQGYTEDTRTCHSLRTCRPRNAHSGPSSHCAQSRAFMIISMHVHKRMLS